MPFVKGMTGNPKGRPKALVDIRDLARKQTNHNLQALMFWRDQKEDPGASVRSAIALHEIAWGKPSQAVAVSGDLKLDHTHSLAAILRAASQSK